jgi:hypothetical protein
MTAPYCAICKSHVSPDESHVQIEATLFRTEDQDDQEDYLVHTECWKSISDGWMEPA